MLVDFYVSGSIRKAYARNFRLGPETLCQIFNITVTFYFVKDYNDFEVYNFLAKVFEVIIFIRMLKLLTLLNEIAMMRVIVETLSNMIRPIVNLFFVTYTIMYEFALLGSFFYGGEV